LIIGRPAQHSLHCGASVSFGWEGVKSDQGCSQRAEPSSLLGGCLDQRPVHAVEDDFRSSATYTENQACKPNGSDPGVSRVYDHAARHRLGVRPDARS
jgi:hypothetical protein